MQLLRYTDWHRLECALDRFWREIDELREQGWSEARLTGIANS